MSNVIAGDVLAAGLRKEFSDTYMNTKREADAELAQCIEIVSSDKRTETYGWFESAPHFSRWDSGDTIPVEGMDSEGFSITNFKFGVRVPWDREDREDDQTGSLFPAASGAGRSAAELPEEFFFEVLLNSASLLPAIPTAPNGQTIFHSSHGGGVGNIVTGSGVASVQAVETDVWDACELWRRMLDTKGKPLFTNAHLSGTKVIICGAHNEAVVRKALQQDRMLSFIDGTSTSNTGHSAAVSNLLPKQNFVIWPTSRIASGNDDMFMVLTSAPKKAIVIQERTAIEEKVAHADNSDSVRTNDEEYIQWRQRLSAGVAEPYGIVQINN